MIGPDRPQGLPNVGPAMLAVWLQGSMEMNPLQSGISDTGIGPRFCGALCVPKRLVA